MRKVGLVFVIAVACAIANSTELTARQTAVLKEVRAINPAKVAEVAELITSQVANRSTGTIVWLTPSNLGTQVALTVGDTAQVSFFYAGIQTVNLYIGNDLSNSIGSFTTSNANAYGVQTLLPSLVATPGTYTLHLVGGGVTADSDPFVLNPATSAGSTLTLAAACPSSVTVGNVISFVGVATGGKSPYTFAWSGDASVGGTGLATATMTNGTLAAQATAYTASMKVTDADGTSVIASCQVTVNAAPVTPTPDMSQIGVDVTAWPSVIVHCGGLNVTAANITADGQAVSAVNSDGTVTFIAPTTTQNMRIVLAGPGFVYDKSFPNPTLGILPGGNIFPVGMQRMRCPDNRRPFYFPKLRVQKDQKGNPILGNGEIFIRYVGVQKWGQEGGVMTLKVYCNPPTESGSTQKAFPPVQTPKPIWWWEEEDWALFNL